ncbi:BET1-like protein [Trichoplax sp. H2]|nr:BET1-like protein [Trichoplax sp. H2]|eukprot:RDD39777.1 BET1-like protein [Trichoplax sp. H2]
MKRSGYPGADGSNKQFLEEENDRMTDEMSHKVSALKTISIQMGDEIRGQTKWLKDMDTDFDKTGGFLQGAMGKLTSLSRAGHGWIWCYMLLFVLFVFFVIYIVLKWK